MSTLRISMELGVIAKELGAIAKELKPLKKGDRVKILKGPETGQVGEIIRYYKADPYGFYGNKYKIILDNSKEVFNRIEDLLKID